MAGRPNTRIHHNRDGRLPDDDFDLCAGLEAPVAADGRTQGHDGGCADILQATSQDGVGIDIGEHGEAFLHEDLRGGKGFDGIGQEVVGVGVDLQFDPHWQTGCGGEPCQAHGLVCVHCAAGVREDEVFLGIDEIENVREGILFSTEIGAAERDCDDLASARIKGVAHGCVG